MTKTEIEGIEDIVLLGSESFKFKDLAKKLKKRDLKVEREEFPCHADYFTLKTIEKGYRLSFVDTGKNNIYVSDESFDKILESM